VKPAAFDYHRVERLEEAFVLLDRHGDEARLLAGGQSLVPMLNFRIGRFGHLVDINRLRELDFLREAERSVEIGALTRHAAIERSELLQRHCPILTAAARDIGHVAIRERGTFGGSLALADPAAELPLIATLLDAELDLASSNGRRTVRAREFFLSVFTTALEPNEVLTRATFPVLAPGAGWGFHGLSRRVGDFAVVNAATTVVLDGDGDRIERLQLALGGIGTTPIALAGLERAQRGVLPEPEWPEVVAARAAEQVEPHGDQHASAETRRDLVRVLLARALRDALRRAKAGG
jgi:carbon-monoxide dehydrogenase medium subunit